MEGAGAPRPQSSKKPQRSQTALQRRPLSVSRVEQFGHQDQAVVEFILRR